MIVARHRAIDQLRRDARYRDKLALLERVVQEPDDRLRLMFTCCHPALSRETQVPDPANRLRPDHRPDRTRLSGLRVGYCAAAGASAAEDRTGRHSLPRAP